jgi:transcriptional regulator with XRE-family HTH domain
MAKKITEAEILEYYRESRGMGRTEFAAELGMSKQSYSTYINNGVKPDLEGLQDSAVTYVGTWIGDLCVALLSVRDATIPCICLEHIGDNGPCPKHHLALAGGILKTEKVLEAVR